MEWTFELNQKSGEGHYVWPVQAGRLTTATIREGHYESLLYLQGRKLQNISDRKGLILVLCKGPIDYVYKQNKYLE